MGRGAEPDQGYGKTSATYRKCPSRGYRRRVYGSRPCTGRGERLMQFRDERWPTAAGGKSADGAYDRRLCLSGGALARAECQGYVELQPSRAAQPAPARMHLPGRTWKDRLG